jgi:heme/copper-type cytochrome/quinol oxidase subunit 2
MSITTIVAVFLMVIGAIFGFAARHDYRKAGRQWTLSARIHRRTAFVLGSIGAALLLFALLS